MNYCSLEVATCTFEICDLLGSARISFPQAMNIIVCFKIWSVDISKVADKVLFAKWSNEVGMFGMTLRTA